MRKDELLRISTDIVDFEPDVHRPSALLAIAHSVQQHEATSVLVRDACFGAPAPNYIAGATEPIRAIPHLYFLDPDEGLDRNGAPVLPDFVVDVSEHMELKRNMLGCHESQRAWLQKHHNMDNYIETMEEWTRARGALAGFAFGEGFRQYKCHPYPRTPLLQQLLSDRLKLFESPLLT